MRLGILRAAAIALTAFAAITVGTTASAATHGTTSVATVRPNIQEQSCSNGTRNWLHMYQIGVDGAALCIGFTGTDSLGLIPQEGFDQFCPGNNNGYFTIAGTSSTFRLNFSHGQGLRNFPSYQAIQSVTITGWSGSAAC